MVQIRFLPARQSRAPARNSSAPTIFSSKAMLWATTASAWDTASANCARAWCKETPSARARSVVMPWIRTASGGIEKPLRLHDVLGGAELRAIRPSQQPGNLNHARPVGQIGNRRVIIAGDAGGFSVEKEIHNLHHLKQVL